MIVSTAIVCMALTIYHEARGEPRIGQVAVAQVLWTRADNNRNKVCYEAFRPKQFSWANVGVSKHRFGWEVAKLNVPTDMNAWMRAVAIADRVLKGKPDPTRGATHYHADYVKPRWANSFTRTAQIGSHIFYR